MVIIYGLVEVEYIYIYNKVIVLLYFYYKLWEYGQYIYMFMWYMNFMYIVC